MNAGVCRWVTPDDKTYASVWILHVVQKPILTTQQQVGFPVAIPVDDGGTSRVSGKDASMNGTKIRKEGIPVMLTKIAQYVCIDAVDQEINSVLNSPVTRQEIDRAIKQAKALFAYSSENISNQAFWLGYSDMFASYDWFENYVDHLAQVTPESVLDIARSYLNPNNRVVGFYNPEES